MSYLLTLKLDQDISWPKMCLLLVPDNKMCSLMAQVQPFCYHLWKWYDSCREKTDVACFNLWVNSSTSCFWIPAAVSLPLQQWPGYQLLSDPRWEGIIYYYPSYQHFPCIVLNIQMFTTLYLICTLFDHINNTQYNTNIFIHKNINSAVLL